MNKVRLISIRFLLLVACLFYSNTIKAYDFEVDGLCYNIISDNQIEVTYRPPYGSYFGVINIPEIVNYQDKEYIVTSIGTNAFFACKGLTGSLILPKSLKSIGNNAFDYCSGLSGDLIIPDSVEEIGDCAFRDCTNLKGILTLSNSLIKIGDVAFANCGFTGSLIFPNSLKEIGYGAFGGCKGFAGSLIIPNTLEKMGIGAFEACSGFSTLVLPNTMTTISPRTFWGCSGLSSMLNLPTSLKKIGYAAFYGCCGLTEPLTIPASVDSIGYSAFNSCTQLKLVISEIIVPFEIAESVFANVSSDAILKVPKESINSYLAYAGWITNFKEIEEMEVSSTNYTLSIISSGNGSVSYSGMTVRGKTSSFTVNKGTNATITFTPDNGYQIKSVKVNNSAVTVTNNQYTLNNISVNTTVEVEFEKTPADSEGAYNTYITCAYRSSHITKTGSVVQNSVNFEVMNSGNKSIYITKLVTKDPDTKEVLATSTDKNILGELEGGTMKTYSVSLNKDIIPIWEITYTYDNKEYSYDNTQYVLLYITANKYGVVKFLDTSVGEKTMRYSIMPESDAIIEFVPEKECVLSKLSINGTEMTSSILDNKYTISKISSSIIVSAIFDKTSGNNQSINGHEFVDLGLPSGKYWSTVNYGANKPEDAGYYLRPGVFNEWGDYWKAPTKEEMQELIDECVWTWTELNGMNGFDIKGPNGNSMFLPAAGQYQVIDYYSVGSIAYYTTSSYDGYSYYWIFEGSSTGKQFVQRTAMIDSYPIRPISTVKNESVFSTGGLNFSVISSNEKTANLAKGNYGKVLEVPVTVKYPSTEWKIVGIDKGALSECDSLAAVIWNPEFAFTENVDNPNMLLYVKSASYAPSSIKNVVVNGAASSIVLSDASGKNDFYCPKEFTANTVNYMHHYTMETGIGNARGWETIALPFDVQKITHQSKGEIVPFANWKSGDAKKPFWLMTYGSSGWVEANSIKANAPYIISMPNHSNYKSEFRLNGNVSFSAENVTIPPSDNLLTSNYNGRTFSPNYANQSDNSYYALNVNNDYVTYSGNDLEGSKFLIGLRTVHPFEAYMTSASQARMYIAIDEDMTTGIGDITEIMANEKVVRVYNLNGQLIMEEENKSVDEIKVLLSAGVYIVNGKKLIIK